MSAEHKVDNRLQQAMLLHQQGLIQHAQSLYESILKHNPSNLNALHLLGVLQAQQGNHQHAIKLIGQAIRLDDTQAPFHNNLGLALQALKHQRSAQQSFERALGLQPNFYQAHANLGICLQEQGLLPAAIASFNRALTLYPKFPEAYFGRGIALHASDDLENALQSYNQAIALQTHYPKAYCNRGLVLKDMHRFEEAITSFSTAIEQQPTLVQAYTNRGNVLQRLNQFKAAIADYDRAIALSPLSPDNYANKSNALDSMGYLEEALSNCQKALSIDPNFPEAYCNQGEVLFKLDRLQEAIGCFQQALRLRPHFNYLSGGLLHLQMKLSDWSSFDSSRNQLLANIKQGKKASGCFPVLAVTDDLSLQYQTAQIWANDKYPVNPILGPIPKLKPGPKIRVGYYSADFHNHATLYLIAELFERHDRNRFELFAFSFGPDKQDTMRARSRSAFDQFFDVRHNSDAQVAALSRQVGIDIAIDLKGYTQGERFGIFACRAAPIQASYLGYPGTVAAPYIDYLIADSIVIPEHHRIHYSEKIAYLPHSYQVNDSQRVISSREFTRHELGLPEDAFVYCCFNNSYKITPEVFESWIRILNQVPGSVLWLFQEHPETACNLRQHAQQRGLDPARLVFAPRMELPDHLARHRLADLFLDTRPYNAHTTASDALWAGLPVLTCMGESFANRVAGSLLHAVGLPELVTVTPQEYEMLAIRLATSNHHLAKLRNKLNEQRRQMPLFNAKQFTSDIELLYQAMYQRHQNGLAPVHLVASQLQLQA